MCASPFLPLQLLHPRNQMLHFGWLRISHCRKSSLKYSGEAETFPVVEKTFVRTANAYSVFWCVIGSGWKFWGDVFKFSQLINSVQFRQLQKAKNCKKPSEVCTSSDKLEALLSEGNWYVPGTKVCVWRNKKEGKRDKKFSLWYLYEQLFPWGTL